jgi:hypothetical protein
VVAQAEMVKQAARLIRPANQEVLVVVEVIIPLLHIKVLEILHRFHHHKVMTAVILLQVQV